MSDPAAEQRIAAAMKAVLQAEPAGLPALEFFRRVLRLARVAGTPEELCRRTGYPPDHVFRLAPGVRGIRAV